MKKTARIAPNDLGQVLDDLSHSGISVSIDAMPGDAGSGNNRNITENMKGFKSIADAIIRGK